MHAQEQNNSWTEIITPEASVFNLHLKEVWHYRDLLMLFVKRDLAAQFRQTILGPLWHLLQPVFTTIMFLIVFNKIAKISTEELPAVLFYITSITIWNFFASCLTSTSATFTTNAAIFGKIYFPRLVMPLSTVISNIVKFAIQFGLLIAVILFCQFTGLYSFHFGWHNLLLPVIVIIMACVGLGTGIIISSLTTKYRDLAILITFGVQLLMYITPVAYPLSYLQQSGYKTFIQWNPLSPLVEGFRYSVFGHGTFDTGFFVYSISFAIISLLAGVILFNKVERNFMDTV